MEVFYNYEIIYVYYIGLIILRFGDNLSFVCKYGYRFVVGIFIRVCWENGLWSGEKFICKCNNY